MILTILTIALAFYWLLRETDCLRIRLLIGDLPKIDALQCENKPLKLEARHIIPLLPASKPVLLLDTIHVKFNPSEFIPLDIPETTGDMNIIAKRS